MCAIRKPCIKTLQLCVHTNWIWCCHLTFKSLWNWLGLGSFFITLSLPTITALHSQFHSLLFRFQLFFSCFFSHCCWSDSHLISFFSFFCLKKRETRTNEINDALEQITREAHFDSRVNSWDCTRLFDKSASITCECGCAVSVLLRHICVRWPFPHSINHHQW